jgi:osmotically-inducible protein OsmY
MKAIKNITRLFILFVMIYPMVGCLPAVIVAGAAASASVGGAVIYDKRSFKTMNQDHLAHSVAMNALTHDPLLVGHSHISLSVFNHVGLLVGQAQTPEVRERAYQIVTNVQNIQRVYNEITVSPPTSTTQRANDEWISTKVRASLLGTGGLRSTNLKVITENGVVYLMGLVTHKQADLAVNTARRISGVVKVVKVFDYEE